MKATKTITKTMGRKNGSADPDPVIIEDPGGFPLTAKDLTSGLVIRRQSVMDELIDGNGNATSKVKVASIEISNFEGTQTKSVEAHSHIFVFTKDKTEPGVLIFAGADSANAGTVTLIPPAKLVPLGIQDKFYMYERPKSGRIKSIQIDGINVKLPSTKKGVRIVCTLQA